MVPDRAGVGTDRAPSDGTDRAPSDGTDRAARDGADHAAGDGRDSAATGDSQDLTEDGARQDQGADCARDPVAVDGQDPERNEEEGPQRPHTAALVEALGVRRNAAIGLAVGVGLAGLAYLVRVLELLGPFGGTREFPGLGPAGYFALLAFVLATTTAMLVTAALTLRSARRLSQAKKSDEAVVPPRTGGTVDGQPHERGSSSNEDTR